MNKFKHDLHPTFFAKHTEVTPQNLGEKKVDFNIDMEKDRELLDEESKNLTEQEEHEKTIVIEETKKELKKTENEIRGKGNDFDELAQSTDSDRAFNGGELDELLVTNEQKGHVAKYIANPKRPNEIRGKGNDFDELAQSTDSDRAFNGGELDDNIVVPTKR